MGGVKSCYLVMHSEALQPDMAGLTLPKLRQPILMIKNCYKALCVLCVIRIQCINSRAARLTTMSAFDEDVLTPACLMLFVVSRSSHPPSMSAYKQAQLFGGSIVADLPDDFTDVRFV